MNKYIGIIVFLGVILIILNSLAKNDDIIITRIEEDSNSMVAINYPHTGSKTVNSLINTYVNDIYNTFKHATPSLSELNIDFDRQTLNKVYDVITLKTYQADYNNDYNQQDFYTIIYDLQNKSLKSINDFIDKKTTTSYIQKEIIKNYHDCITIDNLLALEIDHSFTLDHNNLTIYYQTPSCGLIEITIPSFLNDDLADEHADYFNFDLNKQEIDIDKPVVALTFDDGPSKYTKRIIDYLHSEGATGTFFVLGNKVKSYGQTLRTMLEYGNEIGNHTYNHKWLSRLSSDEIKNQINKTQDIIYSQTGYTPMVLRPTYGSNNKKITNNTSLKVTLWDIDTLDWRIKNSSKIAKRVTNKDCDGKIILMHDTYERTLKALKIIIPELKEKGYQFVTVSELNNVKYLRYLNEQGD